MIIYSRNGGFSDHFTTEAEKIKRRGRRRFSPGRAPFSDQEVRRLLDNLFVEGELKPLAGYNARILPSWTHVGMVIDRKQDRKLRLQGLLTTLEKRLQAELTYKDWQRIAAVYGEAKHLLLSMELPAADQAALDWKVMDQRINQQFTTWMLEVYHGLKNLPYLPEPVMVHHIYPTIWRPNSARKWLWSS